jgi:hypothetical protein
MVAASDTLWPWKKRLILSCPQIGSTSEYLKKKLVEMLVTSPLMTKEVSYQRNLLPSSLNLKARTNTAMLDVIG